MNNCEQYRPMLVGLIDKELTPEEINDVNQHLNRCEACRKEFDELSRQSAHLKLPAFQEPDDAVLEKLWTPPYNRFTRKAGIIMVLGGYVALVGYALFLLVMDGNGDLFPKTAIAALIVGFLILLGSVMRERIATYKTDKYKDVKR